MCWKFSVQKKKISPLILTTMLLCSYGLGSVEVAEFTHRCRAMFQVRVAEGNRGYMDGSVEFSNWLKFIRSTSLVESQNIRAYLLAGQVRI